MHDVPGGIFLVSERILNELYNLSGGGVTKKSFASSI